MSRAGSVSHNGLGVRKGLRPEAAPRDQEAQTRFPPNSFGAVWHRTVTEIMMVTRQRRIDETGPVGQRSYSSRTAWLWVVTGLARIPEQPA